MRWDKRRARLHTARGEREEWKVESGIMVYLLDAATGTKRAERVTGMVGGVASRRAGLYAWDRVQRKNLN